jgi:hypothetical protein
MQKLASGSCQAASVGRINVKRFFPRGIVLNPRDGLLYVSNCPNLTQAGAGNGGQVLNFDPSTLQFKGVFIDDTGGIGGLNRPDGLVIGPRAIFMLPIYKPLGRKGKLMRRIWGLSGSAIVEGFR